MRVWNLVTAFVLASLLSSSLAIAQSPAAGNAAAGNAAAGAASSARPPVVGVDVGYILTNHPSMKSEIERIETEMKTADDQFAAKRDAIIKQMEELRERFNEGTPEYERQEKAIAEADTNFRLELVKKRKEFDESRAAVIFKVHTEINQLLQYYCENTGTTMVVRISREKMDPKKPETVQMVMSQEVLYFQNSADISDWILQGLKQRSGATAARPAATTTR